MMNNLKKIYISGLLLLLVPVLSWGIGGPVYVQTTPGKNLFTLSASGRSATLCISSNDYAGVIRALNDLKTDIGKVTRFEPNISVDNIPRTKEIVIAGTIGKSPLIDQLAKNKKIDIKDIKGKWEAFLIQVVEKPFPGVEKALVIAGSDKRGTIYGIYDVSEQIGVSPWYWWSDVPTVQKEALYIKPGRYIQQPGVRYRGIFLNDEAPALTNWVEAKYGMIKPQENPPIHEGVASYNHEFYSRIFELLLRLKANYLWPAMWNNAFNEDDPENPRLADEYGIVLGTSHQEPMLRAQKEWDRRYYNTLGHWNYYKHPDTLENFWREGIRRNKNYESVITMGLRGANDTEIAGDMKSNILSIENIVRKQQAIIAEEMNPDITKVPQSWCLYKEIMEYYDHGMRVPENITLLWSDDNWGNIRRLPNAEERKRSGGAGVYYHFDYHGDPRSYEWINTNPIAKIWDQMTLAKQYGADRIWVVNVGHFKGYELPMEFFLALAWNTERWNSTGINAFTRLWAERDFGKEYGAEIADILSKYTKFNGRRKPESLSPQTYSLIHYNEAESVVAEYNKVAQQAEALYHKLPKEKQDAFYQVAQFPAQICALVNELYVTAAKNNLYAAQKRASTNQMAAQTRLLFQADTAMMTYYNQVFANGKWNHFMDQTHLGYTDWMPPAKNSLVAIPLKEIDVPNEAILGVSVEGSELAWPGSSVQAALPEFDPFSGRQHYLEIFNRGKIPFEYAIAADVPWLSFSSGKGTVDSDLRIQVSFNEKQMTGERSEGTIKVTGAGEEVAIRVKAFNPGETQGEVIKGFVESGGVVSIEAEHFSKNIEAGSRQWIKIEDYGLTLSGMRATGPVDAPPAVPGKDAPCLEYPLYLFSDDTARVTVVTSPLLNFMPGRDIRFAVSFNNDAPKYITNVPDKFRVHWSNPAWAETVVNQARHCTATLKIPKKGYHTLKVWMIDPGVVIQKIIIDTGGLKPSYLGPGESVFMDARK